MKGVRPVEVFDEEAGLAFSSSSPAGELQLRVRRTTAGSNCPSGERKPPSAGWRGRSPSISRGRPQPPGGRAGCYASQGKVYPMPCTASSWISLDARLL